MVQIILPIWMGVVVQCYGYLIAESSNLDKTHFAENYLVRPNRGINFIRQYALGGAAYLRGEIVTTQLLRGAKEMETPQNKEFKLFQKSGGFAQAKRDFFSVNLANVRVDEMVKGMQGSRVYTGYAGDRTIYLYNWNQQYQQPLISVTHAYKRKGAEIFSTVTEVIRYTD